MAFARCSVFVSLETLKHLKPSVVSSSCSSSSGCSEFPFSVPFSSISLGFKARRRRVFPSFTRIGHKVKAQSQESDNLSSDSEVFNDFKHLLLPITDGNPYLSEGTRQAISTTASLAKKYSADITVVVIDEKQKESLPEHETQMSSIRWHLSQVLEEFVTVRHCDPSQGVNKMWIPGIPAVRATWGREQANGHYWRGSG